MDTPQETRELFLDFYRERGHVVIPSASLLPQNDQSTLFVSSGMQPLLPYFLGKPHPQGKRICNSQRCFRSVDIEEVGDSRHTTFFEMLGNWSFGDYFKKEQIPQVFEFYKRAGLDVNRLCVTVFGGNDIIPEDKESLEIWQGLLPADHIYAYGTDKNWWSRAGSPEAMPEGEIGGTDTEVFYDFGGSVHNNSPFKKQQCHPNCDCGRFIEIGNSVFIQYQKQNGKFVNLPQRNVDYGGGLERLIMARENQSDIFKTSIFTPFHEFFPSGYQEQRAQRVLLDHTRSIFYLANDGVVPSNKGQGYVLRRLVRRSLAQLYWLQLPDETLIKFMEPLLSQQSSLFNLDAIKEEIKKFSKVLQRGLKKINGKDVLTGKEAFFLQESYGLPIEITEQLITVDLDEFNQEKLKHQELSRQNQNFKL